MTSTRACPVFPALSMEDGEQFVDEGDTGRGCLICFAYSRTKAEVFELEVDHEGWFHVAGEDAQAEDLRVAAGGSGDGGVKGGLEVEAGTFGEGESFGDAQMVWTTMIWLASSGLTGGVGRNG